MATTSDQKTEPEKAWETLSGCMCPTVVTSVQHESVPPRGLEGPRANTKSGAPQNGLCEGEILHALKCVLGAQGKLPLLPWHWHE